MIIFPRYQLLRCLFYLGVLFFAFEARIDGWALYPNSWWQPIVLFRALPGPLTLPALHVLQAMWWVSLFLCLVDVGGKAMRLSCALLATIVVGYGQNFGVYLEGQSTLVLCLWAMSWGDDENELASMFRVARIIVLVAFGCAGLSKLVTSGPLWGSMDFFGLILKRILVTQTSFQTGQGPFLEFLIEKQWPLAIVGFSALGLELSAWLGIFWSRAERVLVYPFIGFIASTTFILGFDFFYFLSCFLFWLPFIFKARTSKRLSGSLQAILALFIFLQLSVVGFQVRSFWPISPFAMYKNAKPEAVKLVVRSRDDSGTVRDWSGRDLYPSQHGMYFSYRLQTLLFREQVTMDEIEQLLKKMANRHGSAPKEVELWQYCYDLRQKSFKLPTCEKRLISSNHHSSD